MSLVSFSPTLRFFKHHSNPLSIPRFTIAIANSSPSDFLPSYLVTECGFSPEKAAKVSQIFPRRIHSPDQPDSVITFLKSQGFTDSHLKRLLSVFPLALTLSVETLAPRFRTFHELGFVGEDLITLVCSNPNVLNRNMENQIVPGIELLRSLLGSHSCLMKCLRRTYWQIVTQNIEATSRNISILKDCGLSDHQVMLIVSRQPSMISQKPESLNKLISRLERLGVPRGSKKFHWVLRFLASVSEENVRAKVELFKGFGWSEDDFVKACHKNPCFIAYSSKLLKEKVEFFVNEAGWAASYIALHPGLLTYSLDKRLKPRVAILKALKEKGLSRGHHKLSSAMNCNNKRFFEIYVAPYEEQMPELSELFRASF